MITSTQSYKSCCGNKSFIVELDKPLQKLHILLFKEAKYTVPKNYYDYGVFYILKQVNTDMIIANTSFGSNRVSLKCSGQNCQPLIDELLSLFNSF